MKSMDRFSCRSNQLKHALLHDILLLRFKSTNQSHALALALLKGDGRNPYLKIIDWKRNEKC
jgi:hypothetical protein